MTPESLLERLEGALSELDRGQVGTLCDQLEVELLQQTEPFPVKQARRILSLLRSRRYFDEMCRVGSAFVSSGQRDAKVRRLYAQGLIDSSRFLVALEFLRGILSDPETPSREIAEAWGLTGRVHKQLYINNPDAGPEKRQQTLSEALDAYARVYDADPEGKLWHGINVVALLARAGRDGVSLSTERDYRSVAKALRDEVEEREDDRSATIWDYAVAMEASVALEDAAAAIEWAERYVAKGLHDNTADEFEFGATLRQLQEVWQATPQDFVGESIVPLLEGALLDLGLRAKDGGSVSLKKSSLQQVRSEDNLARLQRVFADDSYKRVQWLQMSLERCQGIGLVGKRDGTGVGTGFVVNGRSLSPKLDDAWYFLTNSHVLTDDDTVFERTHRKPLKPKEAHVTFELLFEEDPRMFAVGDVIWTSPPEELDATLVTLVEPFYEDATPYPVSEDLTDPTDRPRIYIAGHPGGRSLTISLHDNHLIEFDERLIRYRTPTDPGSSGSPVFNDQWELVGLHHAGDKEMPSLGDPTRLGEANEGIRIRAIMAAIEAEL